MCEEEDLEPWYRCVRCRAIFKLKNLIIRHLIAHNVHRFEGDSDTKCVQDWDRVRKTVGGQMTKVEGPLAVGEKGDKRLDGHQLHAQQQTSWAIGTSSTQELNIPQAEESFVGAPFESFLEDTEDEMIIATDNTFPNEDDLYRCRYCSAPFAHSRSRAVHEAKIHNDEIDGYTCQFCLKNFPTIASVQDHYRCTHKVTPPVKKAWQNWKTHGGDINDHLYRIPSPQRDEADEPVLNRVIIESDSNSGPTSSSSAPTQEESNFDNYYFHSESGPVVHPHPLKKHSKPETATHSSKKKNKMKSDGKKKSAKKPKNKPKEKVKLPRDSPFRYQRLKCPKCSDRFRTQWENIVHLGEVHLTFTCEFCSKVFGDKVSMLKHQYTCHNMELGYYQCHLCNKNFGSPRIVQEHVHFEHKGVKVPSTSVVLKWRRA